MVEKGFNSTGSGPSFHIWISGIGSVFDDANDVSHFELMSHSSGMHILFCFELFIAYSSSHPPLGAQRSLLNFRPPLPANPILSRVAVLPCGVEALSLVPVPVVPVWVLLFSVASWRRHRLRGDVIARLATGLESDHPPLAR